MTNMTSRTSAVVEALVSAGLVHAARREEAEAVVARTLGTAGRSGAAAPRASSRALLVEIAAYVGGALVVASIGLFLAQRWADFSETAQVSVLAGIAVLLAVAGTFAARVGAGGYAAVRAGRDEVRRRLTSALLTAAALAAAFAVGRLVDIVDHEDYGDWPGFAGALTMVVLATLAYTVVSSVLGLLAMAASAFMAVTSGWSMVESQNDNTLGMGLTVLGLGIVWLVGTETGLFRELVPARAIGAALSLLGAQMVLFDGENNNLAYALMLAVAVAAFALYLRKVSWPYLVVGVLGVTLVVPEAVIDWTGDSLGPAGGVLVAGLTLLGASLAGFRIRQEATEEEDGDGHESERELAGKP